MPDNAGQKDQLMRIRRVTPWIVNAPAATDGGRGTRQYIFVQVETDEGITGWGEAFGHRAIPTTRTAIDVLIAPLCIGRDPTAISEISLDIHSRTAASDRRHSARNRVDGH